MVTNLPVTGVNATPRSPSNRDDAGETEDPGRGPSISYMEGPLSSRPRTGRRSLQVNANGASAAIPVGRVDLDADAGRVFQFVARQPQREPPSRDRGRHITVADAPVHHAGHIRADVTRGHR
jgi:hypothetical protein